MHCATLSPCFLFFPLLFSVRFYAFHPSISGLSFSILFLHMVPCLFPSITNAASSWELLLRLAPNKGYGKIAECNYWVTCDLRIAIDPPISGPIGLKLLNCTVPVSLRTVHNLGIISRFGFLLPLADMFNKPYETVLQREMVKASLYRQNTTRQ